MRARLPHAVAGLACLTLAVSLWGCGGQQAGAVATTPQQPTIPAEPLELVPSDAQVVVRIDHRAIRGWSQYARLAELARRADCDGASPLDTFGDRTEVVAMAGLLAGDGQVEDLLVFRGDFAGLDMEPLLDEAAKLLEMPAPPPPGVDDTLTSKTPGTSAASGEPARAERGPLVAVRLDDRTLVVGARAPVDAAVGLARGEGSGLAFSADPWVERVPFAGQAVVAYVRADARSAALLQRQTRGVAGEKLGSALADASGGLAVRLDDGLRAAAQIDMASPQAAGDLLSETSRSLGQAELFLRMFQLPPLSQRLDLSVQDRTFLATLTLPEAEVAQLVQLLERVAELPPCPAVQAQGPSAAPAPTATHEIAAP